jgi:hypothetical protein
VPGQEDIVGNETADQLARTGSEHPFTGPEPACGISIGVAKKAVRDWMKSQKNTGNPQLDSNRQRDLYNWAHCQKNEGSVEIKQRPVKMGGRTTYWTLPPKRTSFQNGVDR